MVKLCFFMALGTLGTTPEKKSMGGSGRVYVPVNYISIILFWEISFDNLYFDNWRVSRTDPWQFSGDEAQGVLHSHSHHAFISRSNLNHKWYSLLEIPTVIPWDKHHCSCLWTSSIIMFVTDLTMARPPFRETHYIHTQPPELVW